MTIRVHIPTPMRQFADGRAVIEVQANTVQAALDALNVACPQVCARIIDNGKVRKFVNIYVNDEDVRYLENLATTVKDGDEVSIIPAVAGG